jgi:hypothetical protein
MRRGATIATIAPLCQQGVCQLNGNIKLAARVLTNAVKNRVVKRVLAPGELARQ